MIKTKTILLSCLLMTGAVMADTSNTNVSEGTTVGFEHCYKPGAPIDMSYNSSKVAVGEVSDVRVKLVTTQESGEMEVTVDLDEGLTSDIAVEGVTKYTILPGENSYLMNFRVSSNEDGLYYIRILAKIDNGDGPRMRAFAVPVYVGDAKLKSKSRQVVTKALNSENISVSKAQETIKIIEE